ncbi:hypothetical protein GTO89_00570 [Heliobacterium gestii]|uniref:Uncharacterized protein n=1 Tax=Heliomicrobium gestii TaxID=2699 RepID=A0A845L8I2_HELGE|nr:hypothetical protein [Heliomicrobium gestii]MBM7865259.1 hypothetical protein [Heliomicrobium gestii]MZP41524.1 hypothetical protein [Heliomicrobium gestii]
MNHTVHYWLLLRSSTGPGMYSYSILDFGPSEFEIRRTRRDYLRLSVYPKNALVLVQSRNSAEALKKAQATERSRKQLGAGSGNTSATVGVSAKEPEPVQNQQRNAYLKSDSAHM